MFNFLDEIPYSILILIGLFLVPAPFEPMPHIAEKLMMLKNGTLSKPIDVFDLFFHLSPLILIILKFSRDWKEKFRNK